MASETNNKALYTIGYGSRNLEQFLALLLDHGIEFLIDVRSKPYSRFKPEFSKDQLHQWLGDHKIRYVFMGDSLGGRPDDDSCYSDGHADYSVICRKPFYRTGVDRLKSASQQSCRVAIMCSEGKPEKCHRSKLIGNSLVNEGIEVRHIDENGILRTQADVLDRITGGQLSLFGETFTSRKRYRREPDDSGSFIGP